MDINYHFLVQTFYLVMAAVPTTLNLTFTSLLLSLPLAFFMALVRLRRVRDFQPQPDGSILAWRRLSRSSHELLYLPSGRKKKERSTP